MEGRIELEGLREFQFAVRRAVDRDLGKQLGQVNKSIGRLVISRLDPPPDPRAIGEGRGAAVRPSATRREVLLRVGGTHRADRTPQAQWGLRHVSGRGRSRPKRPHIIATARRHQTEIVDMYLRGINEAMSGAFHDVDP